MSDKDAFLNPHRTHTTYEEGEFPTALKLTASEVERTNALYLLERAIGAMHRSVGTLPAVNMVSVARSIGDMSKVEPPLGGFEGSPDNPQLAYALRDATYNTIPNPSQKTEYDPALDDSNSVGVHLLCEVGCIHDTMGDSEWPRRCRKGYLSVDEGGSNYKHECGSITMVEGLKGVCQNTQCPDWSGKPMEVTYPDSDSETGTTSDILRRYKIVFPKESRLVNKPVIRDYIDCGTVLGETRRHSSDTGGTGVVESGSVSPEDTYGKQTSGNAVTYTIGGSAGSSSQLFRQKDGDTYLVVEIPAYTDLDGSVSVTREYVVSIRSTDGAEWIRLCRFTGNGATQTRKEVQLSNSYVTDGSAQIKVEFYTDSGIIPTAWQEVRVSRIWVVVVELKQRHRNYGMQLELPHSLAGVTEGEPFPANSIYLYDTDLSVDHVVQDAVPYSAVFQRLYDSGTKKNVHLDNMDIYLYQDRELQLANNRYYTISAGCSVAEAAGAILSELIRHASDTNMHVSPSQICHALYDPSVCCASDVDATFKRASGNPYSVNIIGVSGAGSIVEARRTYTYRAVRRGWDSVDAECYWYKATWNPSATQWSLEEVGSGDEISLSWWNAGPSSLLCVVKSTSATDQNGDIITTHDVLPVWVSSYTGGDWYIEMTTPSEFDAFAEGATVTIASRSMLDGSQSSVANVTVYAALVVWQQNDTTHEWEWQNYPGGAITYESSQYSTLSEHTTTLDLPSDAESYHWGVAVAWESATTSEAKYIVHDIVIGTVSTITSTQDPGGNIITSSKAVVVPTSGTPSTIWSSHWPDREDSSFFQSTDSWDTLQAVVNSEYQSVIGYMSIKENQHLWSLWNRALIEFPLDSTDSSGLLGAISQGNYFGLSVARLVVRPSYVSNWGVSGYSWSDPDDSAYVETTGDGFCGMHVGIFLGYVFDEDVCEPYRSKIPGSDKWNYTLWSGYANKHSWGHRRGWQTSGSIAWPSNNPIHFDLNAGCHTQPPCKTPDICCTSPDSCPGQECGSSCNDFDLGSIAYDMYSRKTWRYSPDVVATSYGSHGFDCWGGYNASRLLTTIQFTTTGGSRTLAPDTDCVIDVTNELEILLRRYAAEINHSDVLAHSSTPGTYRMKIGFWISPAWRHPVTSMSQSTYIDSSGIWQSSLGLSNPWERYGRYISLYTRGQNGGGATAAQAPRLHIGYTVD